MEMDTTVCVLYKQFRVHFLVCLAFHGLPQVGTQKSTRWITLQNTDPIGGERGQTTDQKIRGGQLNRSRVGNRKKKRRDM